MIMLLGGLYGRHVCDCIMFMCTSWERVKPSQSMLRQNNVVISFMRLGGWWEIYLIKRKVKHKFIHLFAAWLSPTLTFLFQVESFPFPTLFLAFLIEHPHLSFFPSLLFLSPSLSPAFLFFFPSLFSTPLFS